MASTTSLMVALLCLATSRSRSNGQDCPVNDRAPADRHVEHGVRRGQ